MNYFDIFVLLWMFFGTPVFVMKESHYLITPGDCKDGYKWAQVALCGPFALYLAFICWHGRRSYLASHKDNENDT